MTGLEGAWWSLGDTSRGVKRGGKHSIIIMGTSTVGVSMARNNSVLSKTTNRTESYCY